MKKIFSNILMYVSLAAGLLGSGACQEYVIDSQPEGPLKIQIDAQDTYAVVATAPSKVVFNISSNTPWTIKSDRQWCVPSPAMSASSSLVSEVVVTLEDNIGKESRTATLTIEAEGIDSPKVIRIEQASKENLVVVPYDENVATEGETISFTLVSNKPWEIIPSTAFVSDINKKSGAGSETGEPETISVTVPANAGARRQGTLTVKTDYEEYSFVITQNGITIVQKEDPENFSIAVGGPEGETAVEITANKEWKVEVPKEYQSWLRAEADGNYLKLYTLNYNPYFTPRVGEVILQTKDYIEGFEGVKFEISQGVAFWGSGVAQEDGSYLFSGKGTKQAVSNYLITKGRMTIDISELNLVGGGDWIEINCWSDVGAQANFHLHLKPDQQSNFTCGGGYNWTQATFTKTLAECNAIRKIIYEVVPKEGAENQLVIRLYLNDEMIELDNNIKDIYALGTNDSRINMYFRLQAGQEGSKMVVKSMTWEQM